MPLELRIVGDASLLEEHVGISLRIVGDASLLKEHVGISPQLLLEPNELQNAVLPPVSNGGVVD